MVTDASIAKNELNVADCLKKEWLVWYQHEQSNTVCPSRSAGDGITKLEMFELEMEVDGKGTGKKHWMSNVSFNLFQMPACHGDKDGDQLYRDLNRCKSR